MNDSWYYDPKQGRYLPKPETTRMPPQSMETRDPFGSYPFRPDDSEFRQRQKMVDDWTAEIRKKKPTEWVLYVVVRNLSSMTPGKAQAHSGHAACAFINHASKFPEHKGFNAWKVSTSQGFGTQINLVGDDQDVLDFVHFCQNLFIAGHVYDPTYPYVVGRETYPLIDASLHTAPPKYNEQQKKWLCFRKERTAAYMFVDKNDPHVKNQLDKFTLAP